MKFITVNCINRETEVSINTDKIVLLKKKKIAGSEKEVCEIVLTEANDGKGSVEVIRSVSEIKKLIKEAK